MDIWKWHFWSELKKCITTLEQLVHNEWTVYIEQFVMLFMFRQLQTAVLKRCSWAPGDKSYFCVSKSVLRLKAGWKLSRPRQDYTRHVMPKDCVSAHWSPMCQYQAHTLLRQSPFGYKAQSWVSKALDTDKRLSSHLRTLVCPSAFSTFPISFTVYVQVLGQVVLLLISAKWSSTQNSRQVCGW